MQEITETVKGFPITDFHILDTPIQDAFYLPELIYEGKVKTDNGEIITAYWDARGRPRNHQATDYYIIVDLISDVIKIADIGIEKVSSDFCKHIGGQYSFRRNAKTTRPGNPHLYSISLLINYVKLTNIQHDWLFDEMQWILTECNKKDCSYFRLIV